MKNVIILGSGRSGTSMVAGSLRRAGYEMGHGLKAGTSSNPLGYFESVEINDINEDLLRPVVAPLQGTAVSAWGLVHPTVRKDQHWMACLPPAAETPADPDLNARMAVATARRPFCFKDPRFCYTLPAWRPHLGPDTVFVCVFRQPGRTVTSMMRDCEEQAYMRDFKLTARFAWQVWIHMYDRVVRAHRRQGRWLFLHYDQAAGGRGLRRLSRFLGAPADPKFPVPALKRSADLKNTPRAARVLYWKMKLLSWLPA